MIFHHDLDFDTRKSGYFTKEMQKEPILLIYLDTVVIKVSDFIHMDMRKDFWERKCKFFPMKTIGNI